MNPYSACKLNTKEMKEILLTHPNNKSLKRWVNRQEAAMKEHKADGYSKDFERFWKAYPKTRGVSKEDAFGQWLKFDEEVYEQIIMAAGEYAKDCKKNGTEGGFVKHPSGWLSGKIWQTYKASVEKAKKKASCELCGKAGNKNLITLMIEHRTGKYKNSFSVCDACVKHDGKDYSEVKP